MSSDQSLSVLITNLKLNGRTGSETLTREIALSLRRLGHRPIVYSPVHGAIVEELRDASIPVAEDIRDITRRVGIIHGHHNPTTATAAARFRNTPAVFLSQDFRQWHDVPPRLPNILRFLVVSEALVDRLTVECGIPPDGIERMLNPVDTARFRPGPDLPDRPLRAALFAKGLGYVEAVSEACRTRGIELEIFGSAVGRLTDTPEEVMPRFDIVLGSGLTAMEATSVCAR